MDDFTLELGEHFRLGELLEQRRDKPIDRVAVKKLREYELFEDTRRPLNDYLILPDFNAELPLRIDKILQLFAVDLPVPRELNRGRVFVMASHSLVEEDVAIVYGKGVGQAEHKQRNTMLLLLFERHTHAGYSNSQILFYPDDLSHAVQGDASWEAEVFFALSPSFLCEFLQKTKKFLLLMLLSHFVNPLPTRRCLLDMAGLFGPFAKKLLFLHWVVELLLPMVVNSLPQQEVIPETIIVAYQGVQELLDV